MSNQYLHKGIDNFLRDKERFTENGNGSVFPLRKEAFERFYELGFPSTKHEEWKYTNISPILASEFTLTKSEQFILTADEVRELRMCGKDVYTLVFENGRFNKNLSELPDSNKGVIVGSLAEHMQHPEVIRNLGKHAGFRQESFVALNTAYLQDGAFVYIPAKTQLDRPLYLLYVCDTRRQSAVVYPRNLIIAGDDASVTLAASYHSKGEANPGFTNAVTEIVIGNGARVEWDTIQMENKDAFHINYTEAVVGKNSVFDTNSITLGGNIVRNNLHIVMNDVNANAHLWGLYIADGNSLVDNHTLVDHKMPHCYSNELYKGILDDKAQGVFNGKVFVREDAQKTNAYQSNKNILLSDDALMNAKPQLEIFADDVKCSHGATTGQQDEDALFYLRSRGIGEQKAKAFLNVAFAADIIKNVSVESMQERLLQAIELKLNKNN